MTHHRAPATRRTRPLALRLIPLAMLASLAGASALAEGEPYYYVGLGGGQTRGSFDEQRISNSVITPIPGGFTSQSLDTDRIGTGYKVFGGYQINTWLGVELGYFHLGKQRFTNTTVPAGALTGQLRSQGMNLDLVGTLPLGANLSALARVGAAYARTRAEFGGSGAVAVANATPSERSSNLKLGLGLQYAFNDSVLLRGEAERYRNSDAVGGHGHVNLFSASLVFPFGRAPSSMRRAAYTAPAAAPMAMAAAPAPMPMPMPAAAPVVAVVVAPLPAPLPAAPQRVSYSAESMFGFGNWTLQSAGRSALDTFSTELAGMRYDQIVIEGHTDRLGSSAFNQTLSQQRADAVKAYLVTQGKTCQGQRQSAALIACLQPDRRVEIEVSGTR